MQRRPSAVSHNHEEKGKRREEDLSGSLGVRKGVTTTWISQRRDQPTDVTVPDPEPSGPKIPHAQ